MLVKTWWGIKENNNSHWYKLLVGKYGANNNTRTTSHGSNTKSLLIKNLLYLQEHSAAAPLSNYNQFKWRANKGNRIYFWEEIWIYDVPLANTYHRLYRLSKHKPSYISKILITWRQNNNLPLQLWTRTLPQ